MACHVQPRVRGAEFIIWVALLDLTVPAILASSKSFPLAVLLEEEPKLTLIPLVE